MVKYPGKYGPIFGAKFWESDPSKFPDRAGTRMRTCCKLTKVPQRLEINGGYALLHKSVSFRI